MISSQIKINKIPSRSNDIIAIEVATNLKVYYISYIPKSFTCAVVLHSLGKFKYL